MNGMTPNVHQLFSQVCSLVGSIGSSKGTRRLNSHLWSMGNNQGIIYTMDCEGSSSYNSGNMSIQFTSHRNSPEAQMSSHKCYQMCRVGTRPSSNLLEAHESRH